MRTAGQEPPDPPARGLHRCGGRPRAIGALVARFGAGVRRLLRQLARLDGAAAAERRRPRAPTRAAAADSTRECVGDLLALASGDRHGSMRSSLFPAYLAAVERSGEFIDAGSISADRHSRTASAGAGGMALAPARRWRAAAHRAADAAGADRAGQRLRRRDRSRRARAARRADPQLQSATGDVIVVATVNTFQPCADIAVYAVKMFENGGQGIGQKGKDNGVLIAARPSTIARCGSRSATTSRASSPTALPARSAASDGARSSGGRLRRGAARRRDARRRTDRGGAQRRPCGARRNRVAAEERPRVPSASWSFVVIIILN